MKAKRKNPPESSPRSPPAKPSSIPKWLTVTSEGVTLVLAIQPGAKRSEVVGLHGNALKIKISSPPVDGAANEALVAFLADALSVPRRQVELVRGTASRNKVLLIRGLAEVDCGRVVAALLPIGPD